MFRNLLTCLILLLFTGMCLSQATIKGMVLDESTGSPLPGVTIRTTYPDRATSDATGHFAVRHIEGEVIILILEFNRESITWNSETTATGVVVLGNINFQAASLDNVEQEFPTITLDENDDSEVNNISGLLRTGDDLFGGITDYTFSPAKFRRRGLESQYNEGYMNNLPINDLESGSIYFSNWSGLNDVMRLDENVVGAEFADWGFGGVAGSSNTDLRASSQWRKKQVSYAVTNRNYRNRIMGTISTGLLPSGWALSFSGSRRWSQEGYVPGTFYDGWAYYAAIGKRINEKHSLDFVALGSPYKRGGNSSSIQEMYDLADDHYYNSYWGYQQGEKRSGRIYSGHQPLFMLRHDWTINEKLKLSTALGFQTGKSGTEALDWLYGNDPRPDYYRRLPSYVDDPVLAEQIRQQLSSNESLRQIQWDKLYQINLNSNFTVENVDGIAGNSLTGPLSHYVMEDRRSNVNKKSGNAVLQYQLNDKNQVTLGVNVILQDTRNYKVLTDLLGGEFYLDWDKFAATDFPGNDAAQQNDLRRPNRIVRVGDQFGYDYYSRIRQYSAWIAYKVETRKWELGLSGSAKNHVYWRDGQTQNGKFPDNSFGESARHSFFLPSGKALVRYKIDGRNYFTVSGMLTEVAPTFRNAFVSPRTRNSAVLNLETEQIKLGEARYDYTSPYLKLSVAGYYISSKNGVESTNFYHDDLRTFINFTMVNIDKEYTGIEGAAEYTLVPGLTFEAAAAVGQFIYTSRPDVIFTQDNDGTVLGKREVYAINYYLGETPQSAYTAGFTYKSKHFWTLYANVNHYDRSFININPHRRTTQAVELVEEGSPQWNAILGQEQVDPAWTVDVSFYKSWKLRWLSKTALFGLNIGITNLLNNTDYINGGFEQYRFDFANKDVSSFPNKYSYMQGLNYFLQGSLKL